MKYLIGSLMVLLAGCSGGGGGQGAPPAVDEVSYNAEYSYPENLLSPGDGTEEVSAVSILSCKNNKGETVDTSLCSPPSEAPKKIHKSPAGNVSVPVVGSELGSVTIPLLEGDSFNKKTQSEKNSVIANYLTCESGRVKVGVECKIPGFELIFSPYSAPTKTSVCDGTETLTRTIVGCRNNITLEESPGSCDGQSDPAPTKIHKSPEGQRPITVTSTEFVGSPSEKCLEGETTWAVVPESFSCKSLNHKTLDGRDCAPDVISCDSSELSSMNAVAGNRNWNGSVYDSCLATACVSGYYTALGACIEAPVGSYADGETLTPCQANSTTASTGSTDASACLANAGYFKDVDGIVKEVGVGYYSPAMSNARSSCVNPDGVATLSRDGFTTNASQAECDQNLTILTCNPGKKILSLSEKNCTPTAVGSYSDGSSPYQTACPANTTTLAPGASASTECVSLAGYYQSTPGDIGQECSTGLYQDLVGQSSCKICSSPTVLNMATFSFLESHALTANSCGYQVTKCNDLYISNNGLSCDSGLYMIDINPGAAHSVQYPYFETIGSKTLISAVTATYGNELWVTDGTAAGTTLLKDINSGSTGSLPSSLTAINSTKVIFEATSASIKGIYSSDGTAAGTVLLKSGTGGSAFRKISNGKMLFTGADSTYGSELWITDGTAVGTVLVKDIYSGTTSSIGSNTKFYDLPNGKYLFSATTSANGTEAWITDGTLAGTTLLKDATGGDSRNGTSDAEWSAVYLPSAGLTVFGADGKDINGGYEPWVTNGTAAGTTRLKDINSSASNADSSPRNFTAISSEEALFSAMDPAYGEELWITDGTPSGTVQLADINPGSAHSSPKQFVNLGNGKIVFVANKTGFGRELWVTDGTAPGTQMVKEINVGTGGIVVNDSLVIGSGKALLSINDGTDTELWITDGTSSGTKMLVNLNPSGSSNPTKLHKRPDGKVVFSATGSSADGYELWILDLDSLDGIKGN